MKPPAAVQSNFSARDVELDLSLLRNLTRLVSMLIIKRDPSAVARANTNTPAWSVPSKKQPCPEISPTQI